MCNIQREPITSGLFSLLTSTITILRENDEGTGSLEDMIQLEQYSADEVLTEIIDQLLSLSASGKVGTYVPDAGFQSDTL